MAPAARKGKVAKEEAVVTLGPHVRPGEEVFGVAHIFASFNDTFVHVTDLSGKLEFRFSFFFSYSFFYNTYLSALFGEHSLIKIKFRS